MKNNSRKIYLVSGAALIAASVLILSLIYVPLIRSEVGYLFSPKNREVFWERDLDHDEENKKEAIVPVDFDFGIVIPKISANAKIIADVDPFDASAYQRALTQGVAHASGTALPDESGNVFIFSHSGQDLAEANRYNAVFYLLGKLEPGDAVYLFYQGARISYKVKEKKVVAAGDVQYMDQESPNSTLTLMTCWPAGTTWKRLIIVADKA